MYDWSICLVYLRTVSSSTWFPRSYACKIAESSSSANWVVYVFWFITIVEFDFLCITETGKNSWPDFCGVDRSNVYFNFGFVQECLCMSQRKCLVSSLVAIHHLLFHLSKFWFGRVQSREWNFNWNVIIVWQSWLLNFNWRESAVSSNVPVRSVLELLEGTNHPNLQRIDNGCK